MSPSGTATPGTALHGTARHRAAPDGGPRYRLVRRARPPAPAPVLDPAQRRVVEHAAGPLLVLAGPGTGKTTTLVEAAVARTRAGVPVEHLLMLTFSRRAAGDLRERVSARLGGTLREPVARTLHSYAFGVLRLANAALDLPAPRLLGAAEQDLELRELLAGAAERWPATLRPALGTRAFAGEVRDLLMRAVERGLDGPTLAALGRTHARPDWVAAGGLLREYQEVNTFAQPDGYDPAELIRSATNALRADPRLLGAERATRRRIFVDEFQDTDPAQLELLEVLAAGADELVLVGDPDQSIYAFRGADENAIRDAGTRFGSPRGEIDTVALATCRRSGPVLLAASRRVAAHLPGPAAQRALTAAPGLDPGAVEVALFGSAAEESAYLAGTLRRAHLDGLPWSRMAVIVRSTTTVLGGLRRAMGTAGVPVDLRGEDLPLGEQPAVTVLLDLLAHAAHPDRLDEDDAERLLTGPVGGADLVALRRLRRALRRMFGPGARLADAVRDVPGAAVLTGQVRGPVQRVAAVLAAGQAAVGAGRSPEQVLWAIWAASGLGPRWERAARAGHGTAPGLSAGRDLDAAVALFAVAARYTDRLPHAGVERFADHVRGQQIPGEAGPRRAEPDAVSILTAHAAKGLEWDLVCVAGVQEGSWPDLRRRGSLLGTDELLDRLAGRDPATLSRSAAQLAEERRLFYVAVTRARRRLVVSAVSGGDEQPSRFLDELDLPAGDGRPGAASGGDGDRPRTAPLRGAHLADLVAELRAAVTDPSAGQPRREAAAAQLARLAAAGVPGADPGQWWGLLPLSDDGPVADPGRPVPVSPSRIEAYLGCELRAVLGDLGVRGRGAVSASLGTVIHEIAATAPAGADAAALERMLDERWAALDFGARWYADHERARAGGILARLADWLHASRGELDLVAVEQDFRVPVGDAVLTGRVDRLERDRDGNLVVVDLKTGKSKPRDGEIPANPQLGAYQLAVERGGFAEHGTRSGGAMLVQLAATKNVAEQRQGPLAESGEPGWIADDVAAVAAALRGSRFTARVDESVCRRCDARASCPLRPDGRQVTE